MYFPTSLPKFTRFDDQGCPTEVRIRIEGKSLRLPLAPNDWLTSLEVGFNGPMLLYSNRMGDDKLLCYILLNFQEIVSFILRHQKTQAKKRRPAARQPQAQPPQNPLKEVTFADKKISYRINRSARRKRVQFSLDGEVVVFHIPAAMTDEELEAIIYLHSGDLLAAVDKARKALEKKISGGALLPLQRNGEEIYALLEDGPVRVEIVRSKRRSVSLVMRQPDRIFLKIPLRADENKVIEWLRTKGEWLEKQRRQLLQEKSGSSQFEQTLASGEGILPLFGVERRIEWVSSKKDEGVGEEQIRVYRSGSEADAAQTRARIVSIIKSWALPRIDEVVRAKAQQMGPGKYPLKRVFLTSAKSRWGSCTSQGDIRVHWNAVFISAEELDYLVTHEVAHLHEMNHSPRFWAAVASVCPDYQALQARLKSRALIPA